MSICQLRSRYFCTIFCVGAIPLEELGFQEGLKQDPWTISQQLAGACAGQEHPLRKCVTVSHSPWCGIDLYYVLLLRLARTNLVAHMHTIASECTELVSRSDGWWACPLSSLSTVQHFCTQGLHFLSRGL